MISGLTDDLFFYIATQCLCNMNLGQLWAAPLRHVDIMPLSSRIHGSSFLVVSTGTTFLMTCTCSTSQRQHISPKSQASASTHNDIISLPTYSGLIYYPSISLTLLPSAKEFGTLNHRYPSKSIINFPFALNLFFVVPQLWNGVCPTC
jgi:hypothetical protein